ncbi:Outer membrane protein assembly factor BamA precursor [Poriferisphaera corsica]|uniref:Outer membrane protein assembly factor BamA n=1 Tax=Poriferisphaera corsica TaxID=2528020 RepID=A0A517YPM2_9BACT|nr:outer membrane protein assembly factor BamA [Poriferisphaera corsica]QDU32173.1 Outer membrane protein assembly factor BamA precursor [Poriferisphaera corsica]
MSGFREQDATEFAISLYCAENKSLKASRLFVLVVVLLLAPLAVLVIGGGVLHAQGIEMEHRPIAEIDVNGLRLVPKQLILNSIRSAPGEPYSGELVDEDIKRIVHLGRFSNVVAEVSLTDRGAVRLVFNVVEEPLLADVQVVGNKAIGDAELLMLVGLMPGDPADQFLIDRGQQQIMKAYEDKGFFVAHVEVDDEQLEDSGILIFKVREGPHVRIRGFKFEGNTVYPDRLVSTKIKSKAYFPIFRKGELNRSQLEIDAKEIQQFYKNGGYLDAEVGRRIDLSPNEQDAVVVFVIKEGRQYLVKNIEVQGVTLFVKRQVMSSIDLVSGEVYTERRRENSQKWLEELFGKLGYLNTRVDVEALFNDDTPDVDVLVNVYEGKPTKVGKVIVTGNDTTQSRVILRQLRGMDPGKPFDRGGVELTQKRLEGSPLFSEGVVSILGDVDDEYRDVLVEVKEGETGSFGFGAGISSNNGVLGQVNLTQRNFDITDIPDSMGEFLSGRAFRGAGQYFSLNLQPGNETSEYSVDFREPYFFETDYFFNINGRFFTREREDWNEQRLGGTIGIGQRFGDVWSGQVTARAEQVQITDISAGSPVDVFDVEGENFIDTLGFTLSRSTTDSYIFPSRGSSFNLTFDQFGTFGGDFNFTRVRARFSTYFTLDEDFLGRKSVLSFRTDIGNIFGGEDIAPTFERFYAGGFRSFRGFRFRGVGPRGRRRAVDGGGMTNDPVGGNFIWLVSAQYQVPVWDKFLSAVVFTDQGTVQQTAGIDQWRASVGAGIRFSVPFLSQAPFAVDFGIPLLKQDGDETQLVAFDIAIPLQ